MTALLKRLFPLALLLVFAGLWLVAESRYVEQASPKGVRNVGDHFRRFGVPETIFRAERNGVTFYYLSGFPGGKRPMLAFPSAPPAYIYDDKGQFMEWCLDPGDAPSWSSKWLKASDTPIEIAAFREQFSL